MKKHELRNYLTAAFLLTAAGAFAFTSDGLVYQVTGEKSAEVTGVEDGAFSNEPLLAIPSIVYDGAAEYEVTAIASSAFASSRPTIVEATLPSTLRTIGDYAFKGLQGLKEVNLPEGLESIGEGAFSNLSISKIVLPNSLTSLGEKAFYNCPLTSLTIGNSLTVLPAYCFYNTALEELSIPPSVGAVEEGCFKNCSPLRSIGTVKSETMVFKAGAFAGTSLQNLVVDSPDFIMEDGCMPEALPAVLVCYQSAPQITGMKTWKENLYLAFPERLSGDFNQRGFLYNKGEITIYTAKDLTYESGTVGFGFEKEDGEMVWGSRQKDQLLWTPVDKDVYLDLTNIVPDDAIPYPLDNYLIKVNGNYIPTPEEGHIIKLEQEYVGLTIILSPKPESGVDGVAEDSLPATGELYTLQGLKAGEGEVRSLIENLPEGIYLLKGDDGRTLKLIKRH